MTQPMTRGRNLQLPYYQVILLIPASEAQGTGPFKALWSHGKNTIIYELSAKLFFSPPAHTEEPGLFTVHQDASGLYCCHSTDFFVLRLQ